MPTLDIETLDIVDSNLRVVGKMTRHVDKVPDGFYNVTVEIIASDGKGFVLCIRKPSYKGTGSGKWEFPGGYVQSGENPQQAAIRELEEETGLKALQMIEVNRFIQRGIIRIAFAAFIPNLQEQTIVLPPEEASAYQILTIDKWLELVATGSCEPDRCRAYTTKFLNRLRQFVGDSPNEEKPKEKPPNKQRKQLIQWSLRAGLPEDPDSVNTSDKNVTAERSENYGRESYD